MIQNGVKNIMMHYSLLYAYYFSLINRVRYTFRDWSTHIILYVGCLYSITRYCSHQIASFHMKAIEQQSSKDQIIMLRRIEITQRKETIIKQSSYVSISDSSIPLSPSLYHIIHLLMMIVICNLLKILNF
jgi:hypothetical protein